MAERNLTLKEFWELPQKERYERYKELSEHNKFGVRQAESGVISPPCNVCLHYFGYAKCAAYPEGISGEHIDAVLNDLTTDCGKGYCFKEKR